MRSRMTVSPTARLTIYGMMGGYVLALKAVRAAIPFLVPAMAVDETVILLTLSLHHY